MPPVPLTAHNAPRCMPAARKTQLNEVWVPSQWHKTLLSQQGKPGAMVHVVPEALDADMFDPALWQPLSLPGRRRYAFVAVFKLEDRKGWKEVLRAYVQVGSRQTT